MTPGSGGGLVLRRPTSSSKKRRNVWKSFVIVTTEGADGRRHTCRCRHCDSVVEAQHAVMREHLRRGCDPWRERKNEAVGVVMETPQHARLMHLLDEVEDAHGLTPFGKNPVKSAPVMPNGVAASPYTNFVRIYDDIAKQQQWSPYMKEVRVVMTPAAQVRRSGLAIQQAKTTTKKENDQPINELTAPAMDKAHISGKENDNAPTGNRRVELSELAHPTRPEAVSIQTQNYGKRKVVTSKRNSVQRRRVLKTIDANMVKAPKGQDGASMKREAADDLKKFLSVVPKAYQNSDENLTGVEVFANGDIMMESPSDSVISKKRKQKINAPSTSNTSGFSWGNSSGYSTVSTRSGTSSSGNNVQDVVQDLACFAISEGLPIRLLKNPYLMNIARRSLDLPPQVRLYDHVNTFVALQRNAVHSLIASIKSSWSNCTLVVLQMRSAGLTPTCQFTYYLVNDSSQAVVLDHQRFIKLTDPAQDKQQTAAKVVKRIESVAVDPEFRGRLHVSTVGLCDEVCNLIEEQLQSNKVRSKIGIVQPCAEQQMRFLFKDTIRMIPRMHEKLQICADALQTSLGEFPSWAKRANTDRVATFWYGIVLKLAYWKLDAKGKEYRHLFANDPVINELAAISRLWAPFAFLSVVVDVLEPSQHTQSLQFRLNPGVFMCIQLWVYMEVTLNPMLDDSQKAMWQVWFWSRHRGEKAHMQLAALILDPRLNGAGLTVKGQLQARKLMCPLAEKIATQSQQDLSVSQFQQELKLFVDPPTISSPCVFWSGMKHLPELRKFAMLVCTAQTGHLAFEPVQCGGQLEAVNSEERTSTVQLQHQLELGTSKHSHVDTKLAVKLLKIALVDNPERQEVGNEVAEALFAISKSSGPSLNVAANVADLAASLDNWLEELESIETSLVQEGNECAQLPPPMTPEPDPESFNHSWIDCSEGGVTKIKCALWALVRSATRA